MHLSLIHPIKIHTSLLPAILFFFSIASASPHQRTFSLLYTAKVTEIPAETKNIDIWMPLPSDSRYQKITNLAITSPFQYTTSTEKEYHNTMLYQHIVNPPESLVTSVSFTVLRKEISAEIGYERECAPSRNSIKACTFLPKSDSIALEVAHIINGSVNRTEIAEKLYRHTLSTMTYDKKGQGWGQGDFVYACNVRKGNCTDFHSMFMGYCRNIGIPTRFEIGLSIPTAPLEGITGGYHCWAFFNDSCNWIPVDISEAWKDSSRQDYFFGSLCENRVTLSRGRDIILSPPQKGAPLNFFIYPYVECDGIPFHNATKESYYKAIHTDIRK